MNGWQQLVGHDWAAAHLQAVIANDRLGHAYLLTGPDHIGKTTLAVIFAQALNCHSEDASKKPCGECRSCQLIAGSRHPDFYRIQPELSGRGKLTIKIETIRDLQKSLNLAPYEAKIKVALLTRFDTATIGAMNAFLKTLEEPPPNTLIILTAVDARTMLPTVSSRCRILPLRPIPRQLIEKSLRLRWDIDSERSYLLSHLADGKIGWAIARAQNPDGLAERERALGALSEALEGGIVARFKLAERLAKDGEGLPALLQIWLSWWRDLLILAWDEYKSGAIVNIDHKEKFAKLIKQWSRSQISESLQQTRLSIAYLGKNANTRLTIENLLLSYPVETS